MSDSVTTDDFAAQAASEQGRPAPRRRTRRATAEAAPSEAPAAPDAAPTPRRTRARKAAAASGAEASGQLELPIEAPEGRTRGRRPRAAAEQDAPVREEADAREPRAGAPEQPGEAEAHRAPTRTRRRRTEEAADAAPAQVADQAGRAPEDEPAEPARARVTRRRTVRGASPAAVQGDQGAPEHEQARATEPQAEAAEPRQQQEQQPERDGSAPTAERHARRQADARDASGAGRGSHEQYRQRNGQQRQNGRAQQGQPYGGQNAGHRHERGARDRADQRGDQLNGRNGNRRQRRNQQPQPREPIAPKTNRDELAELKVSELRAKASELGVDFAGVKKAELVDAVYVAMVRQEGFFDFRGILDVTSDGFGFIRTKGYLASEDDIYVDARTIRQMGLRRGDEIRGIAHAGRPNDKYAFLNKVSTICGKTPEEVRNRPRFGDLTPIFPDERLRMEHGKDSILGRCIDLVAPIGKGQRGLIVSPPKAGKTTVLKGIAASIAANNPEVHLICLLVDERPEEVTDMQRSIRGEVVASTFDMPSDNHIAVSELVVERAKRLVELGEDVVILLDSITRLARAYNMAQPASGRILTGGVDSTALYPPKRFLGAARNIENGGSLTILASALVETGSKMDEVIFEEFKGTGNMELRLDRDLADRRIFPAIDPVASGTRKEELLLDPNMTAFVWGLRRILASMNNNERAMTQLIRGLKQTETNADFLVRCAQKANAQNLSF
ncbi:MAG: transcription termination factor Rho [Coriobacteriales bacterium]|jgi:transcription termination factor Rho